MVECDSLYGMFGISEKSGNKELAWEFLKYIMRQPQTEVSTSWRYINYIPVYKPSMKDYFTGSIRVNQDRGWRYGETVYEQTAALADYWNTLDGLPINCNNAKSDLNKNFKSMVKYIGISEETRDDGSSFIITSAQNIGSLLDNLEKFHYGALTAEEFSSICQDYETMYFNLMK